MLCNTRSFKSLSLVCITRITGVIITVLVHWFWYTVRYDTVKNWALVYHTRKTCVKMHNSHFYRCHLQFISYINFSLMLRTSFKTSLWSSKVHNEIHNPVVNKASNCLIFVKGPIRGFVYKPTCEFQYELLNFTTKFGTKFATFTEKLCEIKLIPET
jgi:hypothetical protein